MTIAVIGTGAMASGLARRLAESEFSVVIGSRESTRAQALAAEIGHGVRSGSISGAAQTADVIILAVPFDAARDALASAGDVSGKTVVDISNPLTADFSGLSIGHTTSAAEEIQRSFPGAHVVKALNTVFASLLAHPKIEGKPVTAFYAGDNDAANGIVRSILERSGFRPEFAGGLRSARYLEPLGGLNVLFGYGLGKGTSIAPEWRQSV